MQSNTFTQKTTQNELLLNKLLDFYSIPENMDKFLKVINGETVSLRIIDWFVTNYAKEYLTVYSIPAKNNCGTVFNGETDRERFSVFKSYRLELKAYGKVRFDPFCRRDRIVIPYSDEVNIETTIGQLNFFKWTIENQILEYIEANYKAIESDMNTRNSISKRKSSDSESSTDSNNKTRKRREELSVSAYKSVIKESVKIVVKFN
jgi:uncharacterized protein YlbG (UPF0298 family)